MAGVRKLQNGFCLLPPLLTIKPRDGTQSCPNLIEHAFGVNHHEPFDPGTWSPASAEKIVSLM